MRAFQSCVPAASTTRIAHALAAHIIIHRAVGFMCIFCFRFGEKNMNTRRIWLSAWIIFEMWCLCSLFLLVRSSCWPNIKQNTHAFFSSFANMAHIKAKHVCLDLSTIPKRKENICARFRIVCDLLCMQNWIAVFFSFAWSLFSFHSQSFKCHGECIKMCMQNEPMMIQSCYVLTYCVA